MYPPVPNNKKKPYSWLKNLFSIGTLLLGIGLSSLECRSEEIQEEKDPPVYSFVKIELDNDVILKTDYYYSQGLTLAWSDKFLKNNPINKILFTWGSPNQTYYALSLSQEIFTPKNIRDSLINVTDRPYAGTLYLSSQKTALFSQKKTIWTSSFWLGLIGPLSGAGKVQRYFHEITGSTHPQGWDYQIRNMPIINYNLQIEKALYHIPKRVEINILGKMRLGTMYDDLSLGTAFYVGTLSNNFGLSHLLPGSDSKNAFQVFFFGNIQGRWALYNATLQGGLLVPESPHQLENQDIKHFIMDGEAGLSLRYKLINLAYATLFQSPDFHGGDYHAFSKFTLTIQF